MSVLVSCVRRAQRVRKINRVPTCFTAAYAREARKPKVVPKLCAWLTDTPRPRLLTQPRFGHCLDTMFDSDAPTPTPDVVSRAGAPPGWSVGLHPPRSGARATSTRGSASSRARARRHDTPANRASAGPPLDPRSQSHAAAGPATATSDARRHPEPHLPTRTPARAMEMLRSRPARVETSLIARWAGEVPVAPTAPQLGTPAARRAPASPHADRLNAAQTASARPRSLPPAARRGGGAWITTMDARAHRGPYARLDGGDDRTRSERLAIAGALIDGPEAPWELLRQFVPRGPRYETHAQANAPVVTHSHGYLEPPEAPYEPPVPVATASLRRGARREQRETEPTDSIDLTEKIGRILDDEARRHGIDV